MKIFSIVNPDPWTHDAPCIDRHDLFDYVGGLGAKRDAYAEALRMCRDCPVLTQCRDLANRFDNRGVVLAGAVYNDTGAAWQPRGRGRPAKKTPEDRAAELNGGLSA